jgi:hypothetical protein
MPKDTRSEEVVKPWQKWMRCVMMPIHVDTVSKIADYHNPSMPANGLFRPNTDRLSFHFLSTLRGPAYGAKWMDRSNKRDD